MIITDNIKTLLVLNPAAGKGKGKKIFPAIQAALAEKFINMETEISAYPRHIVEICKKAAKNGFKRIISIGGDGTPFEIINGIFADESETEPSEIALGMIPAGTGNSFLRDFDNVETDTWIKKILAGRTTKVDTAEFTFSCNGKTVKMHYMNILGIGLIADILKLTNEKLKFLGALGYSMAVLIRLFRGMNNTLTLTIDGKTHELKNSALVICNSKYTGGNMKIAPMADNADGKVDVIVFNEVNRRDIISIFSKVFSGTHIQHPKVKIFSGSEIAIDAHPGQLLMADGELLGKTPLTLKVLPKHLTVLA